MSDGMAWIATGWLLALAGVNAALYATWWRCTRDERTFLKDVLAAGVDPIQAAWWLGSSWDNASPQQQRYAAEVAVRLLILAGDAEVDEAGRITVPRGRLGTQKDPVRAALVTTLRRHKGATVYELLEDSRFARFRKVLRSRRPPLRSEFGTYRGPSLTAALVTAFGLSLHAMITRCPVPGLPSRDPGIWTTAWIPLWAVLAALAAIWPAGTSRPWPRFTRHCRAAVTRALAAEDSHTRHRVSVLSSSTPPDRRTPPRATSSRPADSPSRSDRTAPRYDLDDVAESGTYDGGSDSGDFGGGD
ncbi:hypothetical protein [Streptomyces sp. MAR25Y5]|uniref:hypothetical protein n=1 Tax=Streptomyces sp. MAR25Y5 TaxID=2962028 RepID=UPI0020B8E865|nr:hypothetical protein [Streptomyces sp. MAR25Y5]MCP3770071.1 hypothetical protein [Streptomyces sp. MAR25Y5]